MQKKASLEQLFIFPYSKKAKREIKMMYKLNLTSGQAGACVRWPFKHIEKTTAKHYNYTELRTAIIKINILSISC